MPPRLSRSAIDDARARLAKHLPVTRLVDAPSLSTGPDSRVFLKLETELPTGSFKVRGALYALARAVERGGVRGVVASSTGNHGAAVAFAAQALGVRATIFLPRKPNPVKRRRIADLGAEIVEVGPDLAAAWAAAAERARAQGGYFLNDATDADVPAGPATIACEILEQLPSVRTILVPMGDTALIRGVAAAVRYLAPAVRVIGVQAEQAPSYYLSWTEHRVVETATCDTIADGLATRTPVAENVEDIVDTVDEVRLVSEAAMLDAIRRLLIDEHVVSEPAGASATAAWIAAPNAKGDVALLVTGANIAPEVLKAAVCR
jgi:threonine dehydratase